MSFDGTHIICEVCLSKKIYRGIDRSWVCIKCELDKIKEE